MSSDDEFDSVLPSADGVQTTIRFVEYINNQFSTSNKVAGYTYTITATSSSSFSASVFDTKSEIVYILNGKKVINEESFWERHGRTFIICGFLGLNMFVKIRNKRALQAPRTQPPSSTSNAGNYRNMI
jgi:hypothetical protein